MPRPADSLPEPFASIDEMIGRAIECLRDDFSSSNEVLQASDPDYFGPEPGMYATHAGGWQVSFSCNARYAYNTGSTPKRLESYVHDQRRQALIAFLEQELPEDDERRHLAEQMTNGPRKAEIEYARDYLGYSTDRAVAAFEDAIWNALLGTAADPLDPLDPGPLTDKQQEALSEYDDAYIDLDYRYELIASYVPAEVSHCNEPVIQFTAYWNESIYTANAEELGTIYVAASAVGDGLGRLISWWAIDLFQAQ